jgi:hypothetical protein
LIRASIHLHKTDAADRLSASSKRTGFAGQARGTGSVSDGAGPASLLLRARRTGIGCRHQATPGNEILGTVVAIDDAFDQRRSRPVRERDLDRLTELAAVDDAQAAAPAVLSVERGDQPGIVPILDVVVGTVMELDLDGVTVIVDQEDADGSYVNMSDFFLAGRHLAVDGAPIAG